YGSTDAGGAHNYGAVFEVPAGGAERALYSFTGTGGGGADPLAGLVRDGAGKLYGTTASGGASGLGRLFSLPAGGAATVLHTFAGGSAGEYPEAGLVQDGVGTLYGTTYAGALPASEQCSRSMRKVTRPCCTVSGAGRTVNTPPPVWCGT